MYPYLIPVTDDLYDVASRLKSVDENYVLYFNAQTRRYQVYNGQSYAFTVPYDELDCRAVDYARKTAVRNADALFVEIERDNEKLLKQSMENL